MTGRLSCFGWFLRSRGLVAVVAYLTVGMVCAHHLGGDLVTVPFAGSRSVDVGLGPSSLSGILASVLFSLPGPTTGAGLPRPSHSHHEGGVGRHRSGVASGMGRPVQR